MMHVQCAVGGRELYSLQKMYNSALRSALPDYKFTEQDETLAGKFSMVPFTDQNYLEHGIHSQSPAH